MIAKVCDAAFGKPLVTNVLRGQIVEAMVAIVLEPDWQWCGADYAPCDFERPDGWRLEVSSLRHVTPGRPESQVMQCSMLQPVLVGMNYQGGVKS